MALGSVPQGECELDHSEAAEEDCVARQRDEASERRCRVPSTGEKEPEEHQRETADETEFFGTALHGLILMEVSRLVKER